MFTATLCAHSPSFWNVVCSAPFIITQQSPALAESSFCSRAPAPELLVGWRECGAQSPPAMCLTTVLAQQGPAILPCPPGFWKPHPPGLFLCTGSAFLLCGYMLDGRMLVLCSLVLYPFDTHAQVSSRSPLPGKARRHQWPSICVTRSPPGAVALYIDSWVSERCQRGVTGPGTPLTQLLKTKACTHLEFFPSLSATLPFFSSFLPPFYPSSQCLEVCLQNPSGF